MTIQEQVKEDLKTAMLSNDAASKSILRVLIGEFNRIGKDVTDVQATGILKKMVENATTLNDNVEKTILEKYLPKQLSEDELRTIVKDIITSKGLGNIKDMGKIMAALKADYAGQYDGAKANEVIRWHFA